jgi:hypothetical protein
MIDAKHINLYATERLQEALQAVYAQMKRDGLPCEYGGKINASAVILYALEQQKRRKPRK